MRLIALNVVVMLEVGKALQARPSHPNPLPLSGEGTVGGDD